MRIRSRIWSKWLAGAIMVYFMVVLDLDWFGSTVIGLGACGYFYLSWLEFNRWYAHDNPKREL